MNQEVAREIVEKKLRERYNISGMDVSWFVNEPPLILQLYSETLDSLPGNLTRNGVEEIMGNLHRYSQKIRNMSPNEKKGLFLEMKKNLNELGESNAGERRIRGKITEYTSRSFATEDSSEDDRNYLNIFLKKNRFKHQTINSVYMELNKLPCECQGVVLKQTKSFIEEYELKLNLSVLHNVIKGAIRATGMGLKENPKCPNEFLGAYFELIRKKIEEKDSLQQVY